jgi:hypothetical protein
MDRWRQLIFVGIDFHPTWLTWREKKLKCNKQKFLTDCKPHTTAKGRSVGLVKNQIQPHQSSCCFTLSIDFLFTIYIGGENFVNLGLINGGKGSKWTVLTVKAWCNILGLAITLVWEHSWTERPILCAKEYYPSFGVQTK